MSTIPANSLESGTIIRIRARGVATEEGPVSFTFGPVLLDRWTALKGAPFIVEAAVVVRATGPAGSVVASAAHHADDHPLGSFQPSPMVVDTTKAIPVVLDNATAEVRIEFVPRGVGYDLDRVPL